MELVEIKSFHLSEVARIHKKSYGKDHFSASFTMRDLMEYYDSYINMNAYCYISVDDAGSIVGFVIAGYNTSKSLQNFIASHKIKLVLYLIWSPRELWNKVLAKIYGLFAENRRSSASLRLLSIAVDPTFQNRGYGAQIIRCLESKLLENGEKVYGLSVRKTNIRAIEFYNNNGFVVEMRDRTNVYYMKKLSE